MTHAHLEKVDGAEELNAVCGDLTRPIRLLDGAYVKDGVPVLVFV